MSQQDKGKQSKLNQSYKNITIIQNRIKKKMSQNKPNKTPNKIINPP
jgi:hypothetical protein